jgi:hypothetical protein
MPDIAALIDQAFDYRGDVTLDLADGRQLVGYLGNRYPKGTSADRTPRVEMMLPGQDEKVVIAYAEIANVRFTGEDTAAGKSWEAWQAKQAAKKAADAGNTQSVKREA